MLTEMESPFVDDTATLARASNRGYQGPMCLRVASGTQTRPDWSVRDEPVIIGRDPACGLQIQAAGVSRQHCRIFRREDGFYAVDLGSKNGTLLNSVVLSMSRLRHGDLLTLGDARVLFCRPGTPRSSAFEGEEPIHTVLSRREMEIAYLVAEGLTNEEIGARLNISKRTVSTHLARAFRRLGLQTRAGLVGRLLS